MDMSSLGTGVPKMLTPLSWSITGADIACLLASSVGEKCLALLNVKQSMLGCLVLLTKESDAAHEFRRIAAVTPAVSYSRGAAGDVGLI